VNHTAMRELPTVTSAWHASICPSSMRPSLRRSTPWHPMLYLPRSHPHPESARFGPSLLFPLERLPAFWLSCRQLSLTPGPSVPAPVSYRSYAALGNRGI
jgi:hypothetical protein